MVNIERIYTVPLGEAYECVRVKRGRKAVSILKSFALHHMKAVKAKISEGTNKLIFRDGIQKPPRRIKVRIVKDEKSVASVWLIGEEEKKKEEEKAKASEKAAAGKKEGEK